MIAGELLELVGKQVRIDQADDARFERVARGEASPTELASLERSAAADPVLARRLEGSRPLDPAIARRLADRLVVADTTLSPPAPVVAIRARGARRRVWQRAAFVVGPLAAAATVALLVRARGTGDAGDGELPSYSVSATGAQAFRGRGGGGGIEEPSSRLHLAGGAAEREARFEVLLRPATARSRPVVAYAYAFDGGAASRLDADIQVSGDGAVRVRGLLGSLGQARELRIVVGPASTDDAAALRAATTGGLAAGNVVVIVPIDRD